MTFAHVTAEGTIDALGNPPDLEWDGTRWWDLRDPTIRAARGWLEVTETPRPEPVEGGVWESSVALVDGTPTRVWTFRAWTVEELAAQARSVDTLAAIEAIVVRNLPQPAEGEEPTFADLAASQAGAIFAGQRFVWTDGNVWEANTGPLNSNATPETWPQGYTQLTGLPQDVAPWTVGESVKVGDLRTFEGIVYRVVLAHTTQADWTPPASPALWTPQG